MNKVARFLWFCSGAHIPLLLRSPTDTNKYIGIGGTVLFTGILAALSAGYALYTIFQSLLPALFFGILWGLMIFNLDRFIVSSMRKKASAWNDWKLATPRLVFAVLLALVISKPLELKMFEREINRKLDEKKTVFLAESKAAIAAGFPEITALEGKVDTLKSETARVEAYRNRLQQEYDYERFGTKTDGTSGIVGLGSNARKKEQQLDAAQNALDQTKADNLVRIDTLESQIRGLMAIRQAEFEKQQPGIDGFDGLAARLDALHLLTEESIAMKYANIFIILLFIALETAPIFVKLIALRGPYDSLLDLHEDYVEVYVDEQTIKSREKSERRIKEFRLENGVSESFTT
ncbi:DUF4407 domain-containing protein [Anditalea andensis]|uniref:DUF4407 domain-containing protein n=1 Tax=Anditalea andensis TaxID=1048983 RepID=A0A074KWN6_9BACT|nr:DUF4407 domain-containing protein [Anditalea andensis]KEO74401.1 hypothetical protein EL17_06605 [Anditalea andensis]